jgi:hypothetical protein
VRPLATALEEEGFADLGSGGLVESFSRHFMTALDLWRDRGFSEVGKSYSARLGALRGMRRELADNGDLIVRRIGLEKAERRSLLTALQQPSWLDPATGAPRK